MFNRKLVFTALLAASTSMTAVADTVETERHKVTVSTFADGFTQPVGHDIFARQQCVSHRTFRGSLLGV